jgi:hypothetical protein
VRHHVQQLRYSSSTDRQDDVHGDEGNIDLFDLLQGVEDNTSPPLQALDDLDLTNKGKGRGKGDQTMQKVNDWRIALDTIRNSFNHSQLRELVKAAEVPRELISEQQKTLRRMGATKDVLASTLLIHRFGFEDPRRNARRKEARSKKVSVTQSVSALNTYLLFTVRLEELRFLLQRCKVSIGSGDNQAKIGNAELQSITLTGSVEGVEEVQAFIQEFVSNVVTTTETLPALTSMPSTLSPPSLQQLQQLSALTSSHIVFESSKGNAGTVKITSVNKASSQLASNLLTQLQYERQCISSRSYASLTAPSIPSYSDASLPEYSLQAHSNTDDGALLGSSTAFRLTRQGTAIRSTDVLDWVAWGKSTEHFEATSNMPYVQRLESEKAVNGSKIVQSLLETLPSGNEDEGPAKKVFQAEFGHLLFRPNDASKSIMDLLSAPLPGSWPVEHGLAWLREDIASAKEEESLPKRAPTFVPNIPPSAIDAITHNTSGELREQSVSTSKLGNTDGIPEDLIDIFASLNAPQKPEARTTLLGMLSDDIVFTDSLCVRYVRGKQILTVKLTQEQETIGKQSAPADDEYSMRFDDGESERFDDGEIETVENTGASWRIECLSVSSSDQVDMLIPDAPSDVRLSSMTVSEMDAEALNDQGWKAFQANLADHTLRSLSSGPNADLTSPPSSLKIGEQVYSLLDYAVQDQWTWQVCNPDADSSFDEHHPTVTQTNSLSLQTSKASTSMQVNWDRNIDREHVATLWHCVRRLLGPALAQPYGMGKGHST